MTPDELIGRTWYEIGVPPDAVDRLEATRRHVLETGEPAKQTARLPDRRDPSRTESAFKPVIEPDGSIVSTVVTAWDAGERRQPSRGRARLDRTYSILSAIDQVIARTRHSKGVLSEACRIAAEVGGFEMAWVGLVDAAGGDVRVAFEAGRDEGLLATLIVSARAWGWAWPRSTASSATVQRADMGRVDPGSRDEGVGPAAGRRRPGPAFRSVAVAPGGVLANRGLVSPAWRP